MSKSPQPSGAAGAAAVSLRLEVERLIHAVGDHFRCIVEVLGIGLRSAVAEPLHREGNVQFLLDH